MTTRRNFIKTIPAAGAAFAVSGRVLFDETPSLAQTTAPLAGHFHPKGKAPSKHTMKVLEGAKETLPFADTRARLV